MYLHLSRIYWVFDNDHFSAIPQHQLAYISIKSSHLHLIAARPTFIPYTDAVKWTLNHAKPEEQVLNDYIGVYLALFRPKIFAKDYGLSPSK